MMTEAFDPVLISQARGKSIAEKFHCRDANDGSLGVGRPDVTHRALLSSGLAHQLGPSSGPPSVHKCTGRSCTRATVSLLVNCRTSVMPHDVQVRPGVFRGSDRVEVLRRGASPCLEAAIQVWPR